MNTSSSHLFSAVSCVQTFYYFMNQNDTWHIKFPVSRSILVCISHDFELCLGHCCYHPRYSPSSFDHPHGYVHLFDPKFMGNIDILAVYTYTITDWGNPAQLQVLVWWEVPPISSYKNRILNSFFDPRRSLLVRFVQRSPFLSLLTIIQGRSRIYCKWEIHIQ